MTTGNGGIGGDAPGRAGGGNSTTGGPGGDGNDYDQDGRPDIPAVNRPPTDIDLNNNKIREKKKKDTIIGNLATIDTDSPLPNFTYYLVDSAGDRFRIEGDKLIANREFDYEKDNAYSIVIETRDTSGKTFRERFTIRIQDLQKGDGNQNQLGASGGNSMETAFYLGNLTNTLTKGDTIGFIEGRKRDSQDYISFNLVQNGSLSVNLNKLKADADFKVLDSAGKVIGQSNTNGSKADFWSSNSLSAGTYTILVEPGKKGKKGAQTRYKLSFSTTPNPTPIVNDDTEIDPNGTFETGALNFYQGFVPVYDPTASLAYPTSPRIQPGNIGFYETYGRDVDDYIKFTLEERGSIAVSISGLTADANLELYDSSGTLLGQSTSPGTQSDALLGTDFTPGDYYARIIPVGDAQTSYNLSLISDSSYFGFGSILDADPFTGYDQYLGTLNSQYSTDLENSNVLFVDNGIVSPSSDEFYAFRVGSVTNNDIYITTLSQYDDVAFQIYNSDFQQLNYANSNAYYSPYGEYYEKAIFTASQHGIRTGDLYYVRISATDDFSTSFDLYVSDNYVI